MPERPHERLLREILRPLRIPHLPVEEAHQSALDRIWGEEKKVQGISRGNDGLLSKAMGRMRVTGTPDAPNRTERDGVARAASYVEDIERAVTEFPDGDYAAFCAAVEKSGLGLLPSAR